MSILAVTAMVQALVADAITPPQVLEASMIQATPSAAARAISVETVPRLPTRPVTVTVECLVRTSGVLGDCIPAEDGGTGDLKAFRQRLSATVRGAPTDPVLAAAMARTRFYRVRPLGPAKEPANGPTNQNVYRSVLIRITVSPADKAPNSPAIARLASGDLMIDPASVADVASFYPPAARRADARTRITATCRVLTDRSLYCRDPRVDLTETPGTPLTGSRTGSQTVTMPDFDAAFGRATIQAFATMRAQARTASGEDSVGREAPFSLRWQLP